MISPRRARRRHVDQRARHVIAPFRAAASMRGAQAAHPAVAFDARGQRDHDLGGARPERAVAHRGHGDQLLRRGEADARRHARPARARGPSVETRDVALRIALVEERDRRHVVRGRHRARRRSTVIGTVLPLSTSAATSSVTRPGRTGAPPVYASMAACSSVGAAAGPHVQPRDDAAGATPGGDASHGGGGIGSRGQREGHERRASGAASAACDSSRAACAAARRRPRSAARSSTGWPAHALADARQAVGAMDTTA